MRRPIRVAVAAICVVGACGGDVKKPTPSCPVDFYQARCADGDECTKTVDVCGRSTAITCSCSQGQFACPGMPNECPTPDCVANRGVCGLSLEGVLCPSSTSITCDGALVPCECTHGLWQCATVCADAGQDAKTD